MTYSNFMFSKFVNEAQLDCVSWCFSVKLVVAVSDTGGKVRQHGGAQIM